jgi:hypothetical protein
VANQRRQQAETLGRIVAARTRPDSRYMGTGRHERPPDSQWLQPFTESDELRLVNAHADSTETRAVLPDDPPPSSAAWTHRFKESGQSARYELFDHIRPSQTLAERQDGSWIVRRRTHCGEGSDHDPAIVRIVN